MLIISVGSICLFSCVSNEPSAEQVDKSFEEEVYFVAGRVSHQRLPLEGATVKVDGADLKSTAKADGSYQLSFSKKGKYTLRFQKDGFIELVTVVSFDEQAKNRSSLVVSVDMTSVSDAVEVRPDQEIEIADATGSAVLRLLASVAEKTNVSLTVFNELRTLYSSQNVLEADVYGAPYTTIQIAPVGVGLTKRSVLQLKKATSDALFFSSMNLYELQKDNIWKKKEEVTFNKARNAYVTEIIRFASYSFRIPYLIDNVSEVVTPHLNGEVTIDNCGNMRAKAGVEIKANQRCGWEYTSDIHTSIRKTFAGISQKDEEALASIIDEQIASLIGEPRGFYDLPMVLSHVNVSGNSVFLYENYAKETTLTYSFDLTYQGKPCRLSVNVKKQSGMDEQYTETSCYQHSGGQGR